MTPEANKRILVILTNEAFIPSKSRAVTRPPRREEAGNADPLSEEYTRRHRFTGINAFEVGYVWMSFCRQLKMTVDMVSPNGGPTAADPMSMEMVHKDERLRKHLREDRELIDLLGHTTPIENIKPEDYCAVLIPGCHGAMFDLPENENIAKVIGAIYNNGGWVGAIGHGVIALEKVKISKGDYLIKNRNITCYTNQEEREQKYTELLPYLVEDKLRERGAKLDLGKPFESHVITDERLITAQNSGSIRDFLRTLTERLGHRDISFN